MDVSVWLALIPARCDHPKAIGRRPNACIWRGSSRSNASRPASRPNRKRTHLSGDPGCLRSRHVDWSESSHLWLRSSLRALPLSLLGGDFQGYVCAWLRVSRPRGEEVKPKSSELRGYPQLRLVKCCRGGVRLNAIQSDRQHRHQRLGLLPRVPAGLRLQQRRHRGMEKRL
jgi:hypothetical protein